MIETLEEKMCVLIRDIVKKYLTLSLQYVTKNDCALKSNSNQTERHLKRVLLDLESTNISFNEMIFLWKNMPKSEFNQTKIHYNQH